MTVAGAGRSVRHRPHRAAPAEAPARGPRSFPGRLSTAGPVAVLVLLCLFFAVVNSRFRTIGNVQAIAEQNSVALVVALGLTFVIVQGSIDLSAEGTMGLCSMVVALLVGNDVNGHALQWLGVAVALAVGVGVGVLNGLIHTLLRVPSLMVTLGTWSICLGLASALFTDKQPQVVFSGLIALNLDHWLGLSPLVYVAIGALVLVTLVLRHTTFGRYSYAIGGDEHIVRAAGIPIKRYKIAAFAAASLLIGVAAVMSTAQSGFGNPAQGHGYLFSGIAAVVVGGTSLGGGRGGALHTTVGVLIIGVLANGMILLGVDAYLQELVQGALIILAVGLATWNLRSRAQVVK